MKKRRKPADEKIAKALARYKSEQIVRGEASIGAFYDCVLAYLEKFESRLAEIDGRLASVIRKGGS